VQQRHFMFDDDQNTPNDLIAVFEFPNPDGMVTKEDTSVRSAPLDYKQGRD